MYKLQLIGLLVAVCLAQGASNSYFLTPPLPPTAYNNQYYTVQLRVIGMNNPTFSFDNLPSCFTADPNGTIQGYPNQVGSFPVRVHFQSVVDYGYRDIVLRVTHALDGSDRQADGSAGERNGKLAVISKTEYLTYLVGEYIYVVLAAINGKEPYAWNYINLPPQLAGNASGIVVGTVDHEGYYTFSASACDSLGATADSYFTLNIQPQTSTTLSFAEVPNIVPIRYNLQQVYDQQIAATNALFDAIKVLHQNQNAVKDAEEAFNTTALEKEQANSQYKAAQSKCRTALDTKNSAVARQAKATDILSNYQKNIALAYTKLNNAVNDLSSAEKHAVSAQNNANLSLKMINLVNAQFIAAQTASFQAAQLIKVALTININARNDFNIAFVTLSARKQDLQNATNQQQQAAIIYSKTSNAINLARRLNDNAQSNLTSTQTIYDLVNSALATANEEVAQIQKNHKEAADQLGTAEYNLHSAMSTLYVAQARKEQADKATQIVRAQTTSQARTQMFAGCDQQAYPTFSGSATVISPSNNGFELSSGYFLIFGSCTEGEKGIIAGDIINYKGYLKSGLIQCTSFQKNS